MAYRGKHNKLFAIVLSALLAFQMGGVPEILKAGMAYAEGEEEAASAPTISLVDSVLEEGVERVGDWVFNTNTNTIVDYVGSSTSVVIPSEIIVQSRSYPVEHIGDQAFVAQMNQDTIKALVLPEGLKTIGDFAFSRNDIEHLVIPASVTHIGASAFEFNKLQDKDALEFAEGSQLEEIARFAFSDNDLVALDLSGAHKLATIGEEAFSINQLSALELPESLESIGDRAFDQNSLSEVQVPDGLVSYGKEVFTNNGKYVIVHSASPAIKDCVVAGEYGSVSHPVSIWITGIDATTKKTILTPQVYSFNPYIQMPHEELLIEGNTYSFYDMDIKDYKLKSDNDQVLSAEFLAANSEAQPKVLVYTPNVGDPIIENVEPLYLKFDTPLDQIDLLKGIIAYDVTGEDLTPELVATPSTLDLRREGEYRVKISVADAMGRSTIAYRQVTVGRDPLDVETGHGWLMRDFSYSDGIVTGLSESGKEKIRTHKKVVFPDFNPYSDQDGSNKTITHISTGNDFEDKGLTEIIFPEKLSSLGSSHFGNNRLTSLELPQGLKRIPGSAFKDNQLSFVSIPEGVVRIDHNAFANNALTAVSLPDSLREISDHAFMSNQLTSIALPGELKSLGSGVFAHNQISGHVDLPDSLSYMSHSIFEDNKISSFTLPVDCRAIPQELFEDNLIEEAIIPASVETIGYGAFIHNPVKRIVFEGDVKTIRAEAFRGHKMQLDEFSLPASITEVGDYAFKPSEGRIGRLIIPEGIETIGEEAFASNGLRELILPEHDIDIRKKAFAYNKLTDLVLPQGMTHIAPGAFEDNHLSHVVLPEGITRIGDEAFAYNYLTTIDLPASLKSIKPRAFANNHLKELTLPAGVKSIDKEAFSNNKLEELTVPEGVSSIESGAFKNNDLQSVSLPSTLTSIGSSAFEENPVRTLELQEGLERIGSSAFSGRVTTHMLSKLTLPASVTHIESNAFAAHDHSGKSLREVELAPGSKLVSIGYDAFSNNGLQELTLPDTITFVAPSAFTNNTGWTPFENKDIWTIDTTPETEMLNRPRVKLSIESKGVPITPAKLVDQQSNTYIVNPAILQISHVLENDHSYEIAHPTYRLTKKGEKLQARPLDSIFFAPVNNTAQPVVMNNDVERVSIDYNPAPEFNTDNLKVKVQHYVSWGDVYSDGLKDVRDTSRDQTIDIAISSEKATKAITYEKPWVYLDLNQPESARIASARFADGNGVSSEVRIQDGVLMIHLANDLEPGNTVHLKVVLKLAESTPPDGVVDLSHAASLVVDGLRLTSNNDTVGFRRIQNPPRLSVAGENVTEAVSEYDEAFGKKFCKPGEPLTQDVRFSAYLEQAGFLQGSLSVKYPIPRYAGLDSQGALVPNMKAEFIPERNPRWTLDPTGEFLTGIFPNRGPFLEVPCFNLPRAIIDTAIYAPDIEVNFLQDPQAGLYHSDALGTADEKLRNRAAYETDVPSASAVGFAGRMLFKLPDETSSGEIPEESYKSPVESYTYRNTSQVGISDKSTEWVFDPDHLRAYSAPQFLSQGTARSLSGRITEGSLHDGFYDIPQAREKESLWALSYHLQESYSDRRHTIEKLNAINVVEKKLDNRMKYTGVELPAEYRKAQLALYTTEDASGTPFYEKTIYQGRTNFAPQMTDSIKSIKLTFDPNDCNTEDEYGFTKLVFVTELKDPHTDLYSDSAQDILDPKNTFSSTAVVDTSYELRSGFDHSISQKQTSKVLKDTVFVAPVTEGRIDFTVTQSYGDPMESNKDVTYDIMVNSFKPLAAKLDNFKIVDILAPCLNPLDVALSDDFVASSVNPRFSFIRNIDGKGSWGVVIEADQFDSTARVDAKGFPAAAGPIQIASIRAKSARYVNTGHYMNRAWMGFDVEDSSRGLPLVEAMQRGLYTDYVDATQEDSPARLMLAAYPEVTSQDTAFDILASSRFSSFMTIKKGTSPETPWTDEVITLLGDEPYMYRLNLLTNHQSLPTSLDIIHILPYNKDLRLQVNDEGERTPRGTLLAGLTDIGETYEAQPYLTGPVAAENPLYADLFTYRYTIDPVDTIRDTEPNKLRDLTWLSASELPLKSGAPDYSRVTGIRISSDEDGIRNAYAKTPGVFFDIPMMTPHNKGFALDAKQASSSFVRWITNKESEEANESNTTSLNITSESSDILIRKTGIDPMTNVREPLSQVEFVLWKKFDPQLTKDEPHHTMTLKSGAQVEVCDQPVHTFPATYKGIITEHRPTKAITNLQGEAWYRQIPTRFSYVLEERVPFGYKHDPQAVEEISSDMLKAAAKADGVLDIAVSNTKLINMTPLKPMVMNLSFNKIGKDQNPLAHAQFELSATSSTGYQYVARASSMGLGGKVHFSNIPAFGTLPDAEGRGEPFMLRELHAPGNLIPIKPIEIHFAKHYDNDGHWLPNTVYERDDEGDIVKVVAFGYEDVVGNTFDLGQIINKKVDLEAYVIGLKGPQEVAKKYEQLRVYHGRRLANIEVDVADDPAMTHLVTTLTTDENGRIILRNVEAGKEYFFKQKGVDPDYMIYPDVVSLRVDEAGTVYVNNRRTMLRYGLLPNTPRKFENILELHKTDELNGQGNPVPGAVFKLYEIEKDYWGEVLDKKLVDTQVTNSTGDVRFTGFATEVNEDGAKVFKGKSFVLEEDKAPEGYSGQFAPQPFETIEGKVFYESYTAANFPIRLSLHKTEHRSNEPVAGATFALYEGNPVPGTELELVKTNDQGRAEFSYAKFDTSKDYFVHEVGVPEGYNAEVHTEPIAVHLKDWENRVGWDGKVLVHASNLPAMPRILIRKLDMLTSRPLEGVGFELYKRENGVDTLIGTRVDTDQSGVIRFNELQFGQYVIKEVAPLPYFEQGSPASLMLTSSDTSIMTFYNVRSPESYTLHNTAQLAEGDANVSHDLHKAGFTLKRLLGGVPSEAGQELGTDEQGMLTLSNLIVGQEYLLVQDLRQARPREERGVLGGYPQGAWTLHLQDRGPGVKPELVARVYDPLSSPGADIDFAIDNEHNAIELVNKVPIPLVDLSLEKKFESGELLEHTYYGVELSKAKPGAATDDAIRLEEVELMPTANPAVYAAQVSNIEGYYLDVAAGAYKAYELSYREHISSRNATKTGLAYRSEFTPVFSPIEYAPGRQLGHVDGRLVLTNTLVPALAHLDLKLDWEGPCLPDKKPDTWFKLVRDSKTTDPETVAVALVQDGAEGLDFGNQPVVDTHGTPYTYMVVQCNEAGEAYVPEHFEQTEKDCSWTPSAYDDNLSHHFAALNTHAIQGVDISINLSWEGNDLPQQKPTVYFVLERKIADGPYERVELIEMPDGTLTHTWPGLDAVDVTGRPYTYHAYQADQAGDASSMQGFEETNDVQEWTGDMYTPGQKHSFNFVLARSAAVVPVVPDPVQPDPVQPDPVQPDPVQPDPVQPDPVQPDPVQPEVLIPDTTPESTTDASRPKEQASEEVSEVHIPLTADGLGLRYALGAVFGWGVVMCCIAGAFSSARRR